MSNGNPTTKDLGVIAEQHGRDIVSIREYFEALLREQKDRVDERFDIQEKAVTTALASQEKAIVAAITAADRAVSKAEVATEKRFDSVNEFRQTLADQATLQLPRNEAEIRFKGVDIKMDELSKQLSDLRSRVDIGPTGLQNLQSRFDTSSGRSQGIDASWSIIVTVTSLLIAGIALISRFF